MKIIGGGALELPVVEAFDVAGLDDVDAVGGLEAAFNEEEAFLGDGEAEFLEEGRRDDGVADAGFVFEADEDKAFRGAGALAADDVAGDANSLAMFATREVDGAPDVLEVRAQEGHGVRTDGEGKAAVIGGEAFEFGHVR